MCHDHSTAAVAFAAELVHSITVYIARLGLVTRAIVREDAGVPFSNILLQKLEVAFPKICNNLCQSVSYFPTIKRQRLQQKSRRTFPHEKQRMGIIIFASVVVVQFA